MKEGPALKLRRRLYTRARRSHEGLTLTTDHDTAVEAENHSELWRAGISLRREVLGDSYVSESLQRTAGTESEALQTHITETVWGAVWTRPGLDRRSRSLLNLGILVALNQHHELAVHVRGGLRNGLTPGEIVESIVHATAYCGAPAGLAAMRVVQKTLDEESRAAHDTEDTPA